MKLFLCFILYLFSLSVFAQKTALTVRVEGIKAEEGMVLLALYTSHADFLGEDIFMGKEASVIHGKATIVFQNVPYGRYAMSSFFDKNENGRLDTNFIGIPKEPYAFSMNPSSNFGPPSFDEAAFTLDSLSQSITITY